MKSPYLHSTTPLQETYPSRRPIVTPQISPSAQAAKYPSMPPYPVDPNERIQYEQEPKARYVEKDDHVANWVKDQQRIERGEANSEPVSPSRYMGPEIPLQHSRSVPSLYDGTLVSHRSCRHGKHRSSSRRRSRSRHVHNSSDSESPIEISHERRRRRRSRTHYTDSDFTDVTDRWDREDEMRRRTRSRNSHHRKDRDDRRLRREKDGERRRHERDRRHDRDETTTERGSRHRDKREEQREEAERVASRPEKQVSLESPPEEGVFPLSGGISIPQHIIIPPSMGERGPMELHFRKDSRSIPRSPSTTTGITLLQILSFANPIGDTRP
ncbi:hypothetical protein KIN20_012146 [Parelaphostrongylus tenuis]|nr:hypothetical protein KIN20_012146 [Parelaphostrongylus tenuis]